MTEPAKPAEHADGTESIHSYRAARMESAARRVRRTRWFESAILLAALLYGANSLWSAIDLAGSLQTVPSALLLLAILVLIVRFAREHADERHDAERASRLDQPQLRALCFVKGEVVGGMMCEQSSATTLSFRRIPSLVGWRMAAGLVVALFIAAFVVRTMKGDPMWITHAIGLGVLLALASFLAYKARRFNVVKELSIDRAGTSDALLTVTPGKPGLEPLRYRRGDLDLVRLVTLGTSRRKHLSFAAPTGSSGTGLAMLLATSEADDFDIERLHHAITVALAADAQQA